MAVADRNEGEKQKRRDPSQQWLVRCYRMEMAEEQQEEEEEEIVLAHSVVMEHSLSTREVTVSEEVSERTGEWEWE